MITLKRFAGAASLLVLAYASPAVAQTQGAAPAPTGGMPIGIDLGGEKQVDEATKEKRRDIERAYKDATQKIPAAQAAAANDPWANMRGGDEVKKPAAKPAARTAQKKKTPAQ